MSTPAFFVSDSLKKGWELMKANLGFLIAFQLIIFAVLAVCGYFEDRYDFLSAFAWVFSIIANMGLVKASLLIVDGIKPKFDQLYKNWKLFLIWIFAAFLFALMAMAGLILFVIPMFYVFARWSLYIFPILDLDSGPIEALKKASQISKGARWQLFLLFLACIGINILGLLLLGVGYLISAPVTLLAYTYTYRKLLQDKNRTQNVPSTDTYQI